MGVLTIATIISHYSTGYVIPNHSSYADTNGPLLNKDTEHQHSDYTKD